VVGLCGRSSGKSTSQSLAEQCHSPERKSGRGSWGGDPVGNWGGAYAHSCGRARSRAFESDPGPRNQTAPRKDARTHEKEAVRPGPNKTAPLLPALAKARRNRGMKGRKNPEVKANKPQTKDLTDRELESSRRSHRTWD